MRIAWIASVCWLAALAGCVRDECDGVPVHHIPEAIHNHVACTDVCGNAANPPTGGPHCPTWLRCGTYVSAQPRCNSVHNLEHGHAVFSYNCPDGCPDVVAALQKVVDEHTTFPDGTHRILITPDPLLSTRVGAAVWGWNYAEDDVDPTALKCLLKHQDAESPEPGLPCTPL